MAVYRDKDGNIYTTKIIGTQEWLVENLKVVNYKDGSPIPNLTVASEWAGIWGGECLNGALYNGYAAELNGGTGAGSIAPTGWRVSTDTDWNALITYIGGGDFFTGESIAGKKLKQIGNTTWNPPSAGTDDYGFTALGSGQRFIGAFLDQGAITGFHSLASGEFYSGSRFMYKDNDYVARGGAYWYGISIRCVKISTSLVHGQTSIMTDIDGNIYTTICINNLEWMAVNLRVTHYNDGTPITVITDDTLWMEATTEAMCWYNNIENTCTTLDAYCWNDNSLAYKTPYGALYNWHAVNHGVLTPGADLGYIEADGIPDPTWRIATRADYTTLSAYLGGDSVAGGLLKEAGLTHWLTPNTGATNTSGFTALPSGYRSADGSFNVPQAYFYVWVSDAADALTAYYRRIDYEYGTITELSIDKKNGMSVRMVRTYNPDPVIPAIPQPPYNVGNFPAYRFYISDASSMTWEVFPLNFLATSLIDEKESGKVFYRRKFNGSLIFGTNSRVKDMEGNSHNRCDDFDIFWFIEQAEPCQRLYLDIHKIVGGVVSEYWTGYFSTTDGTWDLDRKTFEVSPYPNDRFTLILDECDTKYDILDTTTKVTTTANDGSINQVHSHCHWLLDVIEYIALQIAPAATVVSEFFTNATNPATGLASKTTLLMIAQKSDIIDPAASNHAINGMLSWNELMNILFSMFRVEWDYEPLIGGGTIYVEHESAFPLTTTGIIDIRTQLSVKATNKYSYIKEEMPKYEKFSFMEAGDINFLGVPISYESDCLNSDPKSNVEETQINVTTDLQYIYYHADQVSKDGWVILCNEGTDPYNVIIEAGQITGALLNMHLSWANLQANYFRYNRVLIEGYINGDLYQFGKSRKTREQECTVIFCNPFSPGSEIRTELGELYFNSELAEIKQAEIRPSGEVRLKLRYGITSYNLTPPPTPSNWIRIVVSSCTHFVAVLSTAAPAGGLPVTIKYTVFGAPVYGIRPEVCSNAAPWDIWTIPAGETTAMFDLTPGCEIPVGGCIYYPHVYVDTDVVPGWVVNIEFYGDDCICQ